MNAPMDVLRDAIERQKPVSFEYHNPNKPEPAGYRTGNPHAVFATAEGTINVDLLQTGGAVVPAGTALPAWRDYALKYIGHINILEGQTFETAADYKPYNRKYERKFAKI